MTDGLRGAGFTVLDAASTYFLCVDLAGVGHRRSTTRASRRPRSSRPASPSCRCPPSPSSDPPRHLVRLCFGKKDETIDAGVAAMAKAKEMLA